MVIISKNFKHQEFEQSDKARGFGIISSWTLTGRFMMSDHLPLVIEIKRQT